MTSHTPGSTYCIAVLGATGLVGREILAILNERSFPIGELLLLSSARSAGAKVEFAGREYVVQEAMPDSFKGVDMVLSSAGGSVSLELLPHAAAHGAVSIDNTSAFRMDAEVPLIVPEVNAHRIPEHTERSIIANPNCSTIQLVTALAPIARSRGLKRVIASTYQSVSGAGSAAVDELVSQTEEVLAGRPAVPSALPGQIAFNVLPQIDVFQDDGATREEQKMREETCKILELDVAVDAMCVRVPVMRGHSEAVWIETVDPMSPEEAMEVLASAPGIELHGPTPSAYPTAAGTAGSDGVHVGRVRRDPSCANGLVMWIVSDNLRKGAALNAVQIAEQLIAHWEK